MYQSEIINWDCGAAFLKFDNNLVLIVTGCLHYRPPVKKDLSFVEITYVRKDSQEDP